jgi:WD40 repeat protein/serine/threonine protein kinase
MPAAATADDFIQLVNKSGLVDPEELNRHLDSLMTQEQPPDSPAALSERLVRDGLLTAFQTKYLLRGKYKGLVIGKYKVLEPLGAGGSGHVYLCEHLAMGHVVAIKLLTGVRKDNLMVVERFFREARAAAALDHPNLVKAHDVGHDGNYYYLVMDYVEGVSLHDLVTRQGALAPTQAAHYAAQAAAGLQHLHEAGLVHRDVKPANLLLNRQGTIKILDLGLACFREDRKASLTKKYEGQAILGTADYLAPEQALNSAEVDSRADLYSLGATLYFLLAARAPFEGSPVHQKLLQQVVGEPQPLDQLRTDLPTELAAVVRKMMAKEPALRLQSAKDVVAALAPWTQTPPAPPPEELMSAPRRLAPRSSSHSLGRNLLLCEKRLKTEHAHATAVATNTGLQGPSAVLKKQAEAKPKAKEQPLPPPADFLHNRWVWWAAGVAVALVLTTACTWYAFSGRGPRRAAQLPGSRPAADAQSLVPSSSSTDSHGIADNGTSNVTTATPELPLPTLPPRRTPAWQLGEDVKVRIFDAQPGGIESVVLTPDGRQAVSGCHDGRIRFWDLATARLLATLEGHTGCVHGLAMSRDGRQVLTASWDRSARLWDLETGQEVRRFLGHSTGVNCVAFSPDGAWVLTGSGEGYNKEAEGRDCTLRLWNRQTGQEVRRFEGHTHAVWSAVFSPDGKYVLSGSYDRTVRLWDLATGREVRRFDGVASTVHCVAFSADGQLILAGSADRAVHLWESETGRPVRTFEGHTDIVATVAFAPDGRRILSGGDDRTLRMWDLESAKELARLEGHTDAIWSSVFTPDGRYTLSSSRDRTLRLWNWSHFVPYVVSAARLFEGHTGAVESVVLTSDARQIISGGHDRVVRIWDAATGKELRTLEGHTEDIHSVALSPDGRFVLTSCRDKTARLWELDSGKEVRRFEGHTHGLNSAVFSPDGRWVLTASGDWAPKEADFTLRLWDAATGKEARRFEGHTGEVWAAVFTPDGRQAFSGSFDGTARLWDVETGRELRRFGRSGRKIHAVAVSPDGRRAVTGGADNVVRLWDMETGREIRPLEGHTAVVAALAFSPDGRSILSGADDRTVRLWDVENGRELANLVGHTDCVWGATFSPDGQWAVTCSKERSVRLWRLP